MLTRVGIYARISEDRDNDEKGVTNQLENLRLYCEERGWEVREYKDNDISAKSRKLRPDYERMMSDGATGAIEKIVVFHQSRLWRNREERAEGIERLRRSRVILVSMRGPELDMRHAYSRSLAAMAGEFDTMESDLKSERVKLESDRRAEAGEWHGGTIAFGLRGIPIIGDDGLRTGTRIDHHPVNAPLVREAARRVLAGESLYSVCRDWARRGILTQRGTNWRSSVLRSALITPSVVGIREHEGSEHRVPWEPILDREQWENLRTLLLDPSREFKQPIAGSWEGKRALNGIVKCTCGANYVAQRDRESPRLVCRQPGDTFSSIKYHPLERFVLDLVLARLESPEFQAELARREVDTTDRERVLRDELAALDARRRRIGDAVEVGAYTKAEAAARVNDIARTEHRLREEQAKLARSHVLDGVETVADALDLWESADVTRQRRFLASFISEVIVGPHPEGRCRTLPRRRGESEESVTARREAHDLETLTMRVDVRWLR